VILVGAAGRLFHDLIGDAETRAVRLTDRLHAPNEDATFAQTKPEVEVLFTRVYGAAPRIERLPALKEPLALRIKAGSDPTLEALLEKLGGPPVALSTTVN